MEYSNKRLSENFVPLLKKSFVQSVFPTIIPKAMANKAAPTVGTKCAITWLIPAMITHTISPGKISSMFCFARFNSSIIFVFMGHFAPPFYL